MELVIWWDGLKFYSRRFDELKVHYLEKEKKKKERDRFRVQAGPAEQQQ